MHDVNQPPNSPLAQQGFDSLEDQVAVLAADGTILAVNRSWHDFGVSRGLDPAVGGVGSNYLRVCEQPGDDAGRGFSAVTQGIRDVIRGATAGFHYEYPCSMHYEDGWFSMRVTPLRGSAGGEVVVSHHDITHRHRAEQALIAAEARASALAHEAQQANEAKSTFISSLSHEFRTPLNAIIGFSQLLELEQELDPDTAESVREILTAGRHLKALLDDMLDLSRVESGHFDMHTEVVPVAELMDACMQTLMPEANRKQLTVTREGGEDVAVLADRRRLKQVFLNILSNGIKYNFPGGELRVHFQAMHDTCWGISFTDSGMGIPAARQNELFTAFNRIGRESSDIQGSGIGLALSRCLVEQMGGHIHVHSTQGQGSTFRVALPMAAGMPARSSGTAHVSAPAPGLPANPGTAASLSAATTAATTTRVARVIYVEDDPINLRLVQRAFQARPDLRLLGISDPALFLKTALDASPDLLMLDINLGSTSGYSLLAWIRQQPALSAVPVLALSANAMAHEVRQGLEAGFDHYLTKPLDVQLLFAAVDALLMKHRPGAAAHADALASGTNPGKQTWQTGLGGES